MIEFFVWWIAAEILGILAMPFAFSIFRNLKDFGYPASKIMGLAIFSYITWILGFATGFTREEVIASLIVFSLASLFIFRKNRKEIAEKILEKKDYIIKIEIAFFLLFLLFASMRACNPDINGLEKFMDYAFLNSLSENSAMPPMDPWLSGENLNYYYFGHFAAAALTKLTAIPTNYTYNLMLALYYSLFSITILSIGFNLSGKFRYGLLSVLFVAILGNSFGLIQLAMFSFPGLSQPIAQGMGLEYPVNCCWSPEAGFSQNMARWSLWPNTRIIPDTINEFPIATFLFGDLHAHFMGFAFQALMLLLILNIFMDKNFSIRSPAALGIPLFFGMAAVVNSWDFAVYSALLGSALFFRFGKKEALHVFPVLIFASLIMVIPFFLTIDQPGSHFNLVENRSGFFQLLVIYSMPVLAIGSYFFHEHFSRNMKIFLFVLFFSALFGYILPMHSLVLAAPLLAFSIPALYARKGNNTGDEFFLLLVSIALLILLATDIAVVDIYENSRFNAVFKLFLPIWVMLGVSSAYAISRVSKSKAFLAVLGLLAIANVLTPVFFTMTLVNSGNIKTLDGTAYMERLNPNDYLAVQWIKANLGENDVILESPGRAYTYDSRISSNSGTPTVIGWVNHQFSWRGKWFSERENDVNTIYNTIDNGVAYGLLKKYNVTYVYVGSVENEKHTPEGLEKFNDAGYFEKVYGSGSAIYRVLG